MKVVNLCGGLGTQLREETEYRPKPVVPVGGLPIHWHTMKLYAAAGHQEFILCLGDGGQVFKACFLNDLWNTPDVTLKLGRQPKIQDHSGHDQEHWTPSQADGTADPHPTSRKTPFCLPFERGPMEPATGPRGTAQDPNP